MTNLTAVTAVLTPSEVLTGRLGYVRATLEGATNAMPGRLAELRDEAKELERGIDVLGGRMMPDPAFRALLDLLMVSDPWPLQDGESGGLLTAFADSESRARGYDGWIVAFHEFEVEEG